MTGTESAVTVVAAIAAVVDAAVVIAVEAAE